MNTGKPIEHFKNKHCTVYHPCQFPDSAMEITLWHNENKVSTHCVGLEHLAEVCSKWNLTGKAPSTYTVYGSITNADELATAKAELEQIQADLSTIR